MIVCVCANVNCKAVRQAIEQGVNSLESLTMETGAGSGCGQCKGLCRQMIDAQPVGFSLAEVVPNNAARVQA